MTKLSGLQRDVLALYRRALRMVSMKPPPSQPKFRLFVRYSFKTQGGAVSPRNISAIEHLLRRGKRQIEMYEDPNVRDCWVSSEMTEWAGRNPSRRDTADRFVTYDVSGVKLTTGTQEVIG
ncbi:hypothetical protein C2E23DRAFT_883775 [Lenzites betulinus]|nr:hypothetical protein C2E23DRAFT_883775 [Lenzites betulinus]